MLLVTPSTRHKWAQNKVVKRHYLLVGKVAPETVLTTDGVITASEHPTKRKQCRAVTGAASDVIDVWLLLRPTSLQLCEPVAQHRVGITGELGRDTEMAHSDFGTSRSSPLLSS